MGRAAKSVRARPGATAPDEEAAAAPPPMVAASSPKSLPGTMAATKPTPIGLSEAVKLPLVLAVDVLPPKLRTVSVAGLMPTGTVTTPLTLGGGIVENENVDAVPSGFSTAFRTSAPTVTV